MGTVAAPRRFCSLRLLCSENLHVARYGLHVRFRSEQQLPGLRAREWPLLALRENELGAVVEEGPQSPGRLLCLWPTQIGRED